LTRAEKLGGAQVTEISARAEVLDRKLSHIYARGSWTPDARDAIQAALDAERADAAVCVRAEIAREMRLRRVGMDEAGIMVCVRAEHAARDLSEARAIVTWIEYAIRGEPVSDFAASFSIVREAMDLYEKARGK
jgi:hypothetical protein